MTWAGQALAGHVPSQARPSLCHCLCLNPPISPCPIHSTAAVPMAPNCIVFVRKNYLCKNFRGKGGTGICLNGCISEGLTLLWNRWAVLTTWKDIAKLEAHFWNHSNKSQISSICMHYNIPKSKCLIHLLCLPSYFVLHTLIILSVHLSVFYSVYSQCMYSVIYSVYPQ